MSETRQTSDFLHDIGERYRLLLGSITEGVFFHEKGVIYEVNDALAEMSGYPLEELFTHKILDLVARESRRELIKRMQAEDPGPYEITLKRKDNSLFPAQIVARSVGVDGRTIRVVIIRDLTHQKKNEAELRAQNERVMELSTPVVKVWNGILLLPLIGVLDTNRVSQITERMLEAVADTDAEVVILDVTGVVNMDTAVARHLLTAVAAARLLGARAIMTGFSPEAAQSLSTLGIDFGDLTTRGSLQSGIAEAFGTIGTTPETR